MKRIIGLGFAALLVGATACCTVAPPAPNTPQANVVKGKAMTGQTE
jgi:hypothetical protein